MLWGMTRWLRQRRKQQKKKANRVVEIKERVVEGDLKVEITPAWNVFFKESSYNTSREAWLWRCSTVQIFH